MQPHNRAHICQMNETMNEFDDVNANGSCVLHELPHKLRVFIIASHPIQEWNQCIILLDVKITKIRVLTWKPVCIVFFPLSLLIFSWNNIFLVMIVEQIPKQYTQLKLTIIATHAHTELNHILHSPFRWLMHSLFFIPHFYDPSHKNMYKRGVLFIFNFVDFPFNLSHSKTHTYTLTHIAAHCISWTNLQLVRFC